MTLRAARWVLLSLLAAAVLFAGFPAGSVEARWGAAAALVFGGLGLAGRGFGAAVAAFSSAVAGGTAVLLGGAPQTPWPALLVLSFGAGFSFRELVTSRAPRPADPASRALAPVLALWLLASLAAAVSARSLWALFRGLDLRIVNPRGMTDAEALAGNLQSLAAVLSGAVLYGILRALGSDDARRALRAVVAGAAVSGLAAFVQARGGIASNRLPYWRMAGRLQGLSSDPNALGLLVGLAIPVAVAGSLWSSRRASWWLAAVALGAGLAASGSRSGFLVAVGGSAILVVAGRTVAARRRARSAAWIGAAAAVVLFGALIASDRHAGGLFQRLVSIFDRSVPIEYRASARPVLWRGAWEAWKRYPVAGVGWNAFSWQLPNVSPASGAVMEGYDNPGNFYLQELAETGLVGLAIFLAFVAAAAREIARFRSAHRGDGAPHLPAGAAAALAAFAIALFLGSHLLAAEVSCAAFVLLAQFGEARPVFARAARWSWAGVAVAAVAWGVSLVPSADAAYAFRHSPGLGLYAPESSPEGQFRWAGRRSAIRLGPAERKRVRVVFRSPSRAGERLRVSSGGQVLFSVDLRRDVGERLVLLAPRARAAVFVFESPSAFRPSASGISGDSRELSIQVFSEP